MEIGRVGKCKSSVDKAVLVLLPNPIPNPMLPTIAVVDIDEWAGDDELFIFLTYKNFHTQIHLIT